MTVFAKGGAAALAILMAMPHIAAAQDDFTIKLGGRLHVDYAIADSDNTDFDVSASALRRARLKGSGQFGKNLKYKLRPLLMNRVMLTSKMPIYRGSQIIALSPLKSVTLKPKIHFKRPIHLWTKI